MVYDHSTQIGTCRLTIPRAWNDEDTQSDARVEYFGR